MKQLILDKAALGPLLLSQGCRTIVVCGGSQNAPVLKELQSQTAFNFFHSFDERSAAFFAMGKAAQQKEPVAILVTSGTAVAECLPALVEAKLRKIPLVILSADKQAEFFDTGFPQTCAHTELTLGAVANPLEIDLSDASTTDSEKQSGILLNTAGPSHWNLRMPDPVADSALSKNQRPQKSLKEFLGTQEQLFTLVSEIPNEEEQKLLSQKLKNCRHPFYCESLSGLQPQLSDHPWHVADIDTFFSSAPDNWGLLKIGTAPLSSQWRNLVRKSSLQNCEVFSISPTEHHHLPDYRLTGKASLQELLRANNPAATLWTEFKTASNFNTAPPRELPQNREEATIIRELHAQLPDRSTMYLSNSLAIRLWEKWNPDRTKNFRYIANRGCNGIDGQVSSFLAQLNPNAENWMLVGDLTLLYDSNGLDFLKDVADIPLRIVLLDNGGGQIFRKLPYFENYFHTEELAKRMINPQSRNWRQWSEFWGLDYFESLKSFKHSSKHALIHCKLSS